jgi:sulfatase modifying factor 1
MKYVLPIVFLLLLLISCSTEKYKALPQQGVNHMTPDAAQTVYATVKSPIVTSNPCPQDMVFVEGDYCPNVEEVCLYYVDNHGKQIPPGKLPDQTGRCGEFKQPTKCLSDQKVHKKFCIDKYEWPNVEGQTPTSWLSYDDAEANCKAIGKRLCTSSEWEFSCEGPTEDPHPYPYGDGYHRDNTSCNTDNDFPDDIDIPKSKKPKDPMSIKLDNMLVPSGSMKTCVSPFGVYDQVGNLDEWVVNETGFGYRTGLKGGHIWGVRARCRPMTIGHNGSAPVSFTWYETSSRCCEDAP